MVSAQTAAHVRLFHIQSIALFAVKTRQPLPPQVIWTNCRHVSVPLVAEPNRMGFS